MGWRSHLRLPYGPENVADFPFSKALKDPTSIGAKPDGTADPLQVLDHLTQGDSPWITPAQGSDDPVWVAAGLAFTVAECLDGRAMMAVQTGEDLTLALLGVAGMSFPKQPGRRKYAHVEIGLEALLKPKAGELSLSAALTSKSFVLDPNCRLRGGVAFKTWFGPNPNKGDFVVTVGGYHHNYRRPEHYPVVPRLGFDWDLSGAVTASGDAYFALTPAAVMAGGGLDVRFHSGAVRAWLTAQVDALIQWKPFYFDVGMRVSVGVSASVKILFVRITITIEVGVSLSVWGPPTGGEAKIHLWFISFTIGFGAKRDADTNALDWPAFREMLPPSDTAVRVLPGAGLIADRPQSADGTLSDDDAWQVSSAGFTFSTDSAVPVGELYLTRSGGSPAERGSKLNIRPMDKTPDQRAAGFRHLARREQGPRPGCLGTHTGHRVGAAGPVAHRARRHSARFWRAGHSEPVDRGHAVLSGAGVRQRHRLHRRGRAGVRPDRPRRRPTARPERTARRADPAPPGRGDRHHRADGRGPGAEQRPRPAHAGAHRTRRRPRRTGYGPVRPPRCGCHRVHRRADAWVIGDLNADKVYGQIFPKPESRLFQRKSIITATAGYERVAPTAGFLVGNNIGNATNQGTLILEVTSEFGELRHVEVAPRQCSTLVVAAGETIKITTAGGSVNH